MPHYRSPHLVFALRVGAILTGVAVSTASSCITPTTPTAQFGAIAGVVSSSQGPVSYTVASADTASISITVTCTPVI